MAAYSSSAAYDLSAYQLPEQKKQPEIRVVAPSRRKRRVASFLNFRVVSAFVVVMTLLSLMIYNQAQLTRVTGTINALNKELDTLENENVKMQSQLESTMSLRTIGEQAERQLGMNKLERNQIRYIYLEQEDRAELTEHSPGQPFTQTVKNAVTSVIARIQEYIKPE